MGVVGRGGNAGAAMFSIFFVYFNYNTAFVLMGLSAVGSAFLSLFMKTEKLAQTYEAVASEAAERKLQEENPGNRQYLDRTHRHILSLVHSWQLWKKR